jgi:hypothetical protein
MKGENMHALASRHDLANPRTKRILVGHRPNGVLVDSEIGAFYFHEKVGGHGHGVVTRLWNMDNGEHVLDAICTDCRGLDDAFAVVDQHLYEMDMLLADF